jgi:hypothetical protein
MKNCVITALVALSLLVGCESPGGPDESPFPGAAASLDSLGELVLEALVRQDTLALSTMRLTEAEHNEVIWPELPASRPEVDYPVDLAWQNIEVRNRRDLGRILPLFKGRALRYRSTECRRGVQPFVSFSVETDCWVVFEDEVGAVLESQIFKDVSVRNGGFKTFRYYGEGIRPRE